MEKYVSKNTLKNWEKLGISENNARLTSRANKTNSKKRIIPSEYFSDKSNLAIILKISDIVKKHDIACAMFSLSLKYIAQNGISFEKSNVKKLINEYNFEIIDELYNITIPQNEFDVLGLIYQLSRTEGEKNINGAYYTPGYIIEKMLCECKMSKKDTFLDPCCGSGAFLMSLKNVSPENLYGYDIDPIAVMLAKFNLIIKYKDYDFYPNITVCDFTKTNRKKYDYIITNPPWGAFKTKTQESFSLFIKNGLSNLSDNGKLIYLLPFSFLSVKKYSDLRRYILENYRLNNIQVLSEKFSGVLTKSIILSLSKDRPYNTFRYSEENINEEVAIADILNTKDASLTFISQKDRKILKKIYLKKEYDLKDSKWGLGIVTGNNKEKIHNIKTEGSEPIFSGKNIVPYKLLPENQYIYYKREDFQQAAHDDIYRAPEKLIYRFISRYPVFAYDNSGALALNSANILIPEIQGFSIKTVMCFLNSELYKYIYMVKFSDIKVLRSNLEELPFIKIDKKTDEFLQELLKAEDFTKINSVIYSLFSITDEEIKYIQKKCAL